MRKIKNTTSRILGVIRHSTPLRRLVTGIAIAAMLAGGISPDLLFSMLMFAIGLLLGSAAQGSPFVSRERREAEQVAQTFADITARIDCWLPDEAVVVSREAAIPCKDEVVLPAEHVFEQQCGTFIDALMRLADERALRRYGKAARRSVTHAVLASLLAGSRLLGEDHAVRVELPAGFPYTKAVSFAVKVIWRDEASTQIHIGVGFGEPLWEITFARQDKGMSVTVTEGEPSAA